MLIIDVAYFGLTNVIKLKATYHTVFIISKYKTTGCSFIGIPILLQHCNIYYSEHRNQILIKFTYIVLELLTAHSHRSWRDW